MNTSETFIIVIVIIITIIIVLILALYLQCFDAPKSLLLVASLSGVTLEKWPS